MSGDYFDQARRVQGTDGFHGAIRHDDIAGRGIPVVDQSVVVIPRPEAVPSNTQIEGQALGRLEGVLDENAELAVGPGSADHRVQARTLERQSEQKVGIPEAAERAV